MRHDLQAKGTLCPDSSKPVTRLRRETTIEALSPNRTLYHPLQGSRSILEEEQKLWAGDWGRVLGNGVMWTCPSHCPYKLIVAVGTCTPSSYRVVGSWYLTSHWGSSRLDHLLFLLKTCFRLLSVLNALSKDTLCFLAICPWRFSLASFILSAKSLAYSTASYLYFFIMSTFVLQDMWVARNWILGALVLGSWPSLLKSFLTTYWQTLSSLERLKSFWMLIGLLGANQLGPVVSVSLGMPFSPFSQQTSWKHTDWHPWCIWNRLAPPLSSSSWSITKMPFIQQQEDSSMDQDTLLLGKTLFFPPLIWTT